MANIQQSILMLGGSLQQTIAIERARDLGYRTVVCDYLPDNPGQHVADAFYLESTTDRKRMLEVAKKERVEGVLAYSSDPAAPTAAYVAEKLGLPTNPLSAVETLSTKHLFRRHLAAAGLPCPMAKSIPVGADAASAIRLADSYGMRYPLVIKPTDSSGSKGVGVVESPDEKALSSALEDAAGFSRNKTLLIEEYIRSSFPRVIGGDIFVANGTVAFWGLMSCLRDESLGGLVPVGERNPSGMSARQEQAVKKVLQDLVTSLGIRFGELNVEVIIGENDVPYVLELGARAGGNMIPVQLSDISGIDLVEANIRYAMGDESPDVAFDGNSTPSATYVLHANRAGVFAGVDVAPEIEPHIYRRAMYIAEGGNVEGFNGANKAIGILFLNFDSIAQMENLTGRIGSLVRPIVV